MPGEEIGVGDQDVAARMLDAIKVGLLEGLPKAQVVAQQQCRAQLAGRRGVGVHRLEQAHPVPWVAAQAGPVQPYPQQVLGIEYVRHQGALHRHGEVEARRGDVVAGVEVVVVVDDIDAADERQLGVDHGHLAMQAAQAAARERQVAQPAGLGPEDAALAAGLGDAQAYRLGRAGAAETVEHHAHLDAAAGSALQAFEHLSPGAVEQEDVGLHMHRQARRVDGLA
ncbi:Uncharacterised protein [Bordetella pertussis]|nr:Uncharacterised protein [Bordetella pertussis]